MSTLKIYQLGLAMVILVTVALLSERFRGVAGIITAMPLQIPLAMWIVYSNTGGNPQSTTEFARGAVLGIVPTGIFCLVCWGALSRGLTLPQVLLVAYGIWLTLVLVGYRFLLR